MDTFSASKPNVGSHDDLVLDIEESPYSQVVLKMRKTQVSRIGCDFAQVIETGDSKKRPEVMLKLRPE